VDHLLLLCDMASAVWSSIFSRFGLSWVMPKQVIDLLSCLWSSGRRRMLQCGKWRLFASFGAFGEK